MRWLREMFLWIYAFFRWVWDFFDAWFLPHYEDADLGEDVEEEQQLETESGEVVQSESVTSVELDHADSNSVASSKDWLG